MSKLIRLANTALQSGPEKCKKFSAQPFCNRLQ